MQLKDIELFACKNRPLPKYTAMPEICLYVALRCLYKSWHNGSICESDAKNEKHHILKMHEEFKKTYEKWCEVYKSYQDNIRKAGMKLSDIEKSEDITEIAFTACEAIGLMTGDSEFAKRQMRKFKENKNE